MGPAICGVKLCRLSGESGFNLGAWQSLRKNTGRAELGQALAVARNRSSRPSIELMP